MLVVYGLVGDYRIARLDRLRPALNLKNPGSGASKDIPWESDWHGGGENADEV